MRHLRQIIRNIIVESVGHPKMDELINRFLNDPRNLKIEVEKKYMGYTISIMNPSIPTGFIGSIEITHGFHHYQVTSDAPCLNAYLISGYSRMDQNLNLGPLLYDIAIELTQLNGLMSDRNSVSAEAQSVWNKYLTMRTDIKRKQLDDKNEKWTKNQDDDCDLFISFMKYRAQQPPESRYMGMGSSQDKKDYKSWIQGKSTSPLSKVYYKDSTPVIDYLTSLDRITIHN